MLTGLYEFENVSFNASSDTSVAIAPGVSSVLVGTLAGVPVGASVDFRHETSHNTGSEVSSRMVYMVRFQLLAARYLKLTETTDPVAITLHRDNLYSKGFVMGGTEEQNEASTAGVATLNCVESEDDELIDSDDAEEVRYWREFAKAEAKLTRRNAK